MTQAVMEYDKAPSQREARITAFLRRHASEQWSNWCWFGLTVLCRDPRENEEAAAWHRSLLTKIREQVDQRLKQSQQTSTCSKYVMWMVDPVRLQHCRS
jgi:hypothetical protein